MRRAPPSPSVGAWANPEDDERALVDVGSGEVPVVKKGLSIQQRSITHRPCDCCDGEVACVRGIVFEDGVTAAVYFATFVLGHERVVRVALGVGDVTALLDLSVRPSGELVVRAVSEDLEIAEPLFRLAEAVWEHDVIVAAYLTAPRNSFIRAIR